MGYHVQNKNRKGEGANVHSTQQPAQIQGHPLDTYSTAHIAKTTISRYKCPFVNCYRAICHQTCIPRSPVRYYKRHKVTQIFSNPI